MLIIKQLAKDMECNIREAEDKIGTAYALRATDPAEAMWYRDMALAHLNFNAKAHELIAAQIAAYKASAEHKEHPEYVEGMQAVWSDRHADIVVQSARVKSMIDSFRT